MLRITSNFVALALLFTGTSGVFAQAEDTVQATASSSETSVQNIAPDRVTSNCFDYYNFESVQITVQPDLEQTVSGEEMHFTGEIENRNAFPLVSGSLVAKVFRINESLYKSAGVFEFVDEFVVEGDLTLPPSAKHTFSHEWTVPSNAEEGKYIIGYSFSQADQYNFLGQAHSEGAIGRTALFSVAADNEEGVVKFKKTETTINGLPYEFSNSLTTVASGTETVIKAIITNPTKQEKIVPVQWNQYAWDAAAEKNRRNTQTKLITLAPGETEELSYVAAGQEEAMIYVTATVSDLDTQNILAVRFAREGVLTPRLIFSGLSGFPLKAGEKQTMALCAQTALGTMEGTSVNFSLRSTDGTMLHEFTRATNINDQINGFIEEFTPEGDFDDVTLTATIKRGDTVLDEVVLHYGCAAISDAVCAELVAQEEERIFRTFKIPLLVGAGIAVVVLALFLGRSVSRRRKKTPLNIDGYEMIEPQ